MAGIFTSVEFYVITITIAIIILGFIFHPSTMGEAYTYFFDGHIMACDDATISGKLCVDADDNGHVTFTHFGIDVCEDSAISIVLTITGDDIRITEKCGDDDGGGVGSLCNVTFYVDCMRSKRYHIYYESMSTGTWASTSFINSPGYHTQVLFKL
ncbi:MAG: hypothetical protein RR061_07455 [Muribaculaceae bacterium]